MNIMMKTLTIGFALILFSMAVWGDIINIDTGGNSLNIQLNGDNWDPLDECGGVTYGATSLSLPGFLDSSTDTGITDGLNSQYKTDLVNWGDGVWETLVYDYSYSSTDLTGTFLIDWYKAFDEHGYDKEGAYRCYHGAEIVAFYDYGAGEDQLNLNWIQLYTETGGSMHHPPYHHVVDGSGDLDPAYYPPVYGPWYPSYYEGEGEGESEGEGVGEGEGEIDMAWSDRPHDSHVEENAWSGSVEFSVFLASYGDIYLDPEGSYYHQEITIYDGITWGYTGFCQEIAEPTSILLLGIGIVGIIKRRNRKDI